MAFSSTMMATLITPNRAQDSRSPGSKTDLTISESHHAQVKRELGILKAADPFNTVEMAIELAAEKMRTLEAMKARDAAVQRLVDAHESLRQKLSTIELLQQSLQQKSRASSPFLSDSAPTIERIEMARMKDEIMRLERTVVELRIEIRMLKESAANVARSTEPPPCYEEGALKNNMDSRGRPLLSDLSRPPTRPTESPSLSQTSQGSMTRITADVEAPMTDACSDYRISAHMPASDEPPDMIAARNAILAGLTLPEEVPDDTLSPLSIPAPLTLQEFISNLSVTQNLVSITQASFRLAHYRLFYAATTQWCPEREEHGYFYAPVFKCNTNPRVAAAHRWSTVDVISRMNKPTECFFNKDGIWYYAGVYKAFRLADLTTKEWAELPIETTQAIVRETIAARKNTSPQNIYEITQLYAAGALKTACVGLQCVGFNNAMYQALLEQARAFAQSKWASSASVKGSPVPVQGVVGLGSGSAWNMSAGVGVSGAGAGMGVGVDVDVGGGAAAAGVVGAAGSGDVAAALAAMSLGRQSQNGHRNENVPAPIGEGRKR